jgi:VWFA-related protein
MMMDVISKDVKEAKEMKKRVVALLGLSTALVFTSLASFTSLGAQQTPVFKSKVEIVQLDVSVLDKHRQPIKGLTEKDFTILEDGKPQKIVAFSTFDMDDTAPPATGWMKDVAPDVTVNELKPESRLFVIVIDDALIPQEAAFIRDSKKVIQSVIDKLGPEDLTAVIFTTDNRKTQNFTADKNKLRAALDKFNPGEASYRYGLETNGIDVDLYFYQSAVRTLGNVADYLATVPNRRKAIFWISPGVPMDMQGAVPRDRDGCPAGRPYDVVARICKGAGPELPCITGPGTCAPENPMGVYGKTLPPGEMADMARLIDDAFRRAQRANVTIYPVDPTGLSGNQQYLVTRLGPFNQGFAQLKATTQLDFLTMTAVNTGGRTVMNTNDFEPGITSIFEENKSYYLLAFEPANPATDGKLHKIQIKVDHQDVDIRTRSGYYAPEAETKEDKKIVKSNMSPEAVALAKAMAGILPNAGMPMKAVVASFAVPAQRLATVTVVLGVTQPVPAAAAKDRVTETTELLTSAFTPEGDARGAQRHTAKVTLRAGSDGLASYEVLARIDLPPGRYQLRLAAHNSTEGKDGSVFVDLTVPDFSNIPFSATQVVLNASPGRVAAPKDLFSPLLPFVPTAERSFAKTDKVTAFLRLYQSGQKPIERVTLVTRIRDKSDQVLVNETQTIAADQFPAAGRDVVTPLPMAQPTPRPGPGLTKTPTPTPTDDKFANLSLRTADVKYQIPMAKLSPGPHLLTIEATLGATTIRRDVRFEIK